MEGLVERVEGLDRAGLEACIAREINEMEENFHHLGTAIVKFWIHIDQDELTRRFQAREENPKKQWKLHEEDWRIHEKWKTYEKAVEEMFLMRPITKYAP